MSDFSKISSYFTDKMDENIVEYLNNILMLKLEDETPKNEFFSAGNCTSKLARVSIKKSKTSEKIINIVKPFFDNAGLVVNTDNGYIEYLSYKYNGPNFIDTDVDIGRENEGYHDDVNSCFLVTHKDNRLKGGNINIYKNYPTFMQILGYEQEEKTEFNLETGSVFALSGNEGYKLNGCSGFGDFNIIHVVFYTKKRSGYSVDNDNDNE
jgi:hypothetical protein